MQLLDNTAISPRDRWLWALIGALVVGQVMAFWMLCLYQVRTAEERHASVRADKTAVIANWVTTRSDPR